jgi:AraC-like DNA-binding protein
MELYPTLKSIIDISLHTPAILADANDFIIIKRAQAVLEHLGELDKNIIGDLFEISDKYGISPANVADHAVKHINSIPNLYILNSEFVHAGLNEYVNKYLKTTDLDISLKVIKDSKTVYITFNYGCSHSLYYCECITLQIVLLITSLVDDANISIANLFQFHNTSIDLLINKGVTLNYNNGSFGTFNVLVTSKSIFESNKKWDKEAIFAIDQFYESINTIKAPLSQLLKRKLIEADTPQSILLEDFASALGVSDRTVKRKLKSENSSYKVIQQQVTFSRLIIELSGHSDLLEIAMNLGYSDRSGLAHLVKEFTGLSLTEFTKAMIRYRTLELGSDLKQTINKIKPIPDTIYKAVTEATDPNCDINKLSELIESDLGAATHLTRIANTANYAITSSNIKKIIMSLGLRSTTTSLLANSLFMSFGKASNYYYESDMIIRLSGRLIQVQREIGKPDILQSSGIFLPMVLFIFYQNDFMQDYGFNPVGVRHVDYMEKVNLATNNTTGGYLKLILSLCKFPVLTLRELTKTIQRVENEFGIKFLDYCLELAILLDQGNIITFQTVIKEMEDQIPSLKSGQSIEINKA